MIAPTFDDALRISRDYFEFCPTCRKWFSDPDNIESIKQGIECLKCDHLRSDHDCGTPQGDGCEVCQQKHEMS